MDRYLSSPNFDDSRPRSNSLSHDFYYFVSSSAPCHRRDAVHISSRLPPLYPISTAQKVFCTSAIVHAVPIPTTVCNSPLPDNTSQATLTQIVSLLGCLGFGIYHQEAPQNTVQLPIYGASADAVPQPVPIPTQASRLMPAVPLDNAVADEPKQRLAQPLPLATSASANPLLPPPSARPEWDLDDCDLLLKSANRPRFTESFGVRIRAFLEDAENFLDMCGRPRDRWARFIISWLGANEAEKVRHSHYFGDEVDYAAFKNGLIT